MSESHSTAPTDKPAKPSKPYPEFPLTAHPAGYWCKKIRGKLHYFGPRFDPSNPVAAAAAADAALVEYNQQADALHTGRTPRPSADGVTVKAAANEFLNHKDEKLRAGELSPRTREKYQEVADLIVNRFGKSRLVADLTPADFTALKNHMSSKWGPVRVGDFVQQIRSVFKHALESELIDRPVRFGPGFARPSAKTIRLHKAKMGPKLFTADELRRLIGDAREQLKAMLLLGINCGFGNADCGNLPLSTLDLDRGWVDYPRPKTGIPRRCALWPETVEALQNALAKRPKPKDEADAGLVFITRFGYAWTKDTSTDPITQETKKLMRALGINGRKGLGFYTVRHVFRTVADEARDQPAADHIMGHEVAHMSSVYRETISDARLKAVSDHVRTWLFGSTAEHAQAGEKTNPPKAGEVN
jgi:integrase